MRELRERLMAMRNPRNYEEQGEEKGGGGRREGGERTLVTSEYIGCVSFIYSFIYFLFF